jgi:penicillin-binding protein 2
VLATNRKTYYQESEQNKQFWERLLAPEEAMQWLATAPAMIRTGYQREYPGGAIFAHIVGYVSGAQYTSDVINGLSGVEKTQNTTLVGRDGWYQYERNAQGQPTRLLAQEPEQIGTTVKLTLDAEMSRVAWAALGNHQGTVIVSQPQSGTILVAVSKPSYLPVLQSSAVSSDPQVSASISQAMSAPDSPLLFRPVGALYPPGSLFKMITATAGLESGALTADTTVKDEGVLKVGTFTYANWYWSQYGRVEGEVNVERALARSNDIFFYKAAEMVGPNRLAEFARLFGLGKVMGWPLGGEQKGVVPDPTWKQQRFGEQWFLGNTYHMGIGQGDVLVTPLQLHSVLSTIATSGRLCHARLLDTQAPVCEELSLRPSTLALIVHGLRGACATGGTAYPFFTTPYDTMCKTGTAEFGAEDAQGHRFTHAWFTVAVSRQPRQPPTTDTFAPDIVITVLMESDKEQPFREGSRDGAPIARTMADWWMAHRAEVVVER